MFYFNYVRLCNKKGISPTAAAIDMGFNRSMVTRWSNGSSPRDATLQKIADYFGVAVSELQKEKPTPQGELSETDIKLRDFVSGSSEEERAELLKFIEFLESKRR